VRDLIPNNSSRFCVSVWQHLKLNGRPGCSGSDTVVNRFSKSFERRKFIRRRVKESSMCAGSWGLRCRPSTAREKSMGAWRYPRQQPKHARLWLTDGSCIRLRPLHRKHVRLYDFVADRPHDGRSIRILTVIDEFPRACLALVVDQNLISDDVLHCLADLLSGKDLQSTFDQTMAWSSQRGQYEGVRNE